MAGAYDWAFLNPSRKIFYNITTTGLWIVVSLTIGTMEELQVLLGMADLHGRVFDFIAESRGII
jgi:high-affinity nickel-transport protein